NSAFAWVTHSAAVGQTGQTQVVRGELFLSGSQGEDVHATLSDAPYAPGGTWVLYARFKVNFSARPGSGGEYFAHFRGANSGAAARVFAMTSGAGTGKLRLGVANGSGSPNAILATDLETNTTYAVVTRLNVATGQTTLWVDPVLETDSSV